jgi:dihydrofolate reductase
MKEFPSGFSISKPRLRETEITRNFGVRYSIFNIRYYPMRKIILNVAVSLDGFIEGPNGEYDWCFNDQDYGLTPFFKSLDAIFMGRKSYEVANQHGGENPWKGITTYLFSRTIGKAPSDEVVLVRGMDEVKSIINQPGKDIWLFGGAELITEFMNAGLIDEYWLSVHPIVLGSGKPLFQNINGRKHFKLVESKIYDTGLASLKYTQS